LFPIINQLSGSKKALMSPQIEKREEEEGVVVVRRSRKK